MNRALLRLYYRSAGFVLALGWLALGTASAEVWRSPVHSWTSFQIEKPLANPGLDLADGSAASVARFLPLPPAVTAAFGAHAVEYEGAWSGYLPPGQEAAFAARLERLGLRYTSTFDRRIQLPWHAFEAGDAAGRTADFSPFGLTAQPLPNLFVAQFAYPIQRAWLDALASCGVERIALFAQRAVLVRAAAAQTLLGCAGVASYLSWIDSYQTTDRISPDMLKNEAPFGYTLHYAPGTDLDTKAAGLGGSFWVVDRHVPSGEGLPFLQVQAKVADLRRLVAEDPDLLSVTYHAELRPSDERQGQITAGNYNLDGTVTATGYRSWLNGRGLLTDTNQQIVGMIDSGFETGHVSDPQNPDLNNPERLIADVKALPPSNGQDTLGHAAMVAGIIAGEGAPGFGSGSADPQGFLYGSGISPKSKLVVAQLPVDPLPSSTSISYLKDAIAFCRNDPATGADRASIVNNSYNDFIVVNGVDRPDNQYNELAQAFDSLVLDGNAALGGAQPTTIVFSAGNYAYDYATGNVQVDSVCSPATAKNVITVGATTSYRPAPVPPLDCQEDPVHNSRPPNQDATSLFNIGLFSGLGTYFAQAGSFGTPLANTVRIKPDLVAPGVRVFSTVPFNAGFYLMPVGCLKYYGDNSHTYGTGTSFSAPVVSGAAALARKWFLDRGTNPNPSLIKAALIATADDNGGFPDHRPSFRTGWGRVSLNRLSDPSVESFYRDNVAAPVGTGQIRSWTRTVSDPSKDIYIVLVWSDPPSDIPGSSQVPLKNDLTLTAEENASGLPFWRGNNFQENKVGVDNGYSHRFTTSSDSILVDSINNVEAIFIPANTFPTGQTLTIKVKGESVPQGPQAFSVYAWNIRLNF